MSNILLGVIELYEVVLAWPTHGNFKNTTQTQPKPWVNPTHVHVCLSPLDYNVWGAMQDISTQAK